MNDLAPTIEVGSHRELDPAHRAQLDARCIAHEVAERAGIYSEHDRNRLARIVGWKSWPLKLGSGLVFPYLDIDGVLRYARVKPERAPIRNGKPAKYLQPSGEKSRPYFPPGVVAKLASGTAEIIITEGEWKALCLSQWWCAIGLSGVWNWQVGDSAGKLLGDLEQIAWHGRKVFIAFDSDSSSNNQVATAMSHLAAALQSRGAVVKIVHIPNAPDGGKQGADDFIASYGREQGPAEFLKLMEAATDPEPIDPGALKMSASDMEAADEAAAIVKELTEDGCCKLRYWNGEFYFWRGWYSPRRDDEVRAELVNRLNEKYLGVKPKHVGELLEQLRAKSILLSDNEPPAWLTRRDGDPSPHDCIAMRNGILHLPGLFSGGQCLLPLTPRLLTTTAVDYEFDSNAPEPVEWFKFLRSVWPNDQQSIDTLQEILGYLISNDTRQQKIFAFIGPTRSGKGAIARVTRKLVGTGNTCGPTLAGLSTNFGLSGLLGKSVAIIADARLGGRTDQSIVVERLLSISGEDALQIDVKYKEPVTTKLQTRLVILSNELPRLTDASSAIVGRLLMLRMTESFLGREDRGLDKKLEAELPSIFLWACVGWRRLNERGYFQQPDSAIELLGEVRDLASPVGAFVRETCDIGPGYSVPVRDLFDAWSTWCRSQGRDHVSNVQTFGRDLMAAVAGVNVSRPRISGDRVRVYEGIRLLSGY